jgi:ribonucleoside-diphosphate reductase alpha chain
MESYKDVTLTQNALEVLKRRYLRKDAEGRVIETPRELFIRVARFIAEADRNYGGGDDQVEASAREFYRLMVDREFMPNSPTLMNAGRELGQLSACFVLPVGDSMEEIFEAVKHAALIHKSGGGTGFSFSRLRPRNSIVASTSGVASGPVSFMKVFNASTEAVKQGGTRRGANMGILRVDHPDIMEFIRCKNDTGEVTNFNISVAITDAFMQALDGDTTYPLYNPHTQTTHVVDGREVHLSAREVFDQIIAHAWQTGEPGVIFLDRINRGNPTLPSEQIEATNPCGEQPLPPYDSCNLGSINLGRFVRDPLPEDYTSSMPERGIDFERLGRAIRAAVHFLDNVIDQNKYPLPRIEEQSKKNRRIGLGIMGWADMLVKLGLPYNCERAVRLAEQVMGFVQSEGHKESSHLAKTRGKFPNWEGSIYAEQNVAMRNATVTTIAPTGTISIIGGCSSGIEPYYAIAFERNVMDGRRLVEVNPLFVEQLRKLGYYSDELVEQISGARSLRYIEGVPESLRALFLTAADVSPSDHVLMQAAFQRECDSSVSKTINFEESASIADVRQAFVQAYRRGCKGVTVYRDNSRPHQVLSTGRQSEHGTGGSQASPQELPQEVGPRPATVAPRPAVLKGMTEKIRTGYGNLYVTVNTRDGKPFEVFAHIGRSGYSTMADTEAICRLISLALRSGVPVEAVIRQLRGIGGASQVFSGGARVSSIPDAIAQVLHRWSDRSTDPKPQETGAAEICPQCSGAMFFVSGCWSCPSCGYSTC